MSCMAIASFNAGIRRFFGFVNIYGDTLTQKQFKKEARDGDWLKI